MLDWPCRQCPAPARDEPRVNCELASDAMVWSGLRRILRIPPLGGYWDCYLVTVILVVWFVPLSVTCYNLE